MAQATYIVVAACLVMLALGVAAHKGTSEEKWLDTEFTTNLWRVISGGDVEELKAIIETNPETVLVRSSDGRGPLWWAYEYHMNEIVDVLLAAGGVTRRAGCGWEEAGGDGIELRSYGVCAAATSRKEKGACSAIPYGRRGRGVTRCLLIL